MDIRFFSNMCFTTLNVHNLQNECLFHTKTEKDLSLNVEMSSLTQCGNLSGKWEEISLPYI